jgi:hypothetical protein
MKLLMNIIDLFMLLSKKAKTQYWVKAIMGFIDE